MKTSTFSFLLVLFFYGFISSAQHRLEREHRIKKAQFPSEALETIAKYDTDFKRLKFYREVDSVQKTYTAKFKNACLFYEMDFNQKGELEGVGFDIKPVDVPEESFQRIQDYLSRNFEKPKIRKMFQAYPIGKNVEKDVKNAFQNLILPDMAYELFVKGKKDGNRSNFEITFDAEGKLVYIREALPANHDRVLY